jgi:hypothetical protein
MKRMKSNANLGRKKYSKHPHVECAGIGTRQLTQAEIDHVQDHVWRLSTGAGPDPSDPQTCLMRSLRLPG